MKSLVKLLLVVSVCLSQQIFAESRADEIALSFEAVKQKIQQARPGLPIDEISESAIPGYFEVRVAGGTLLHVNETGEHFFVSDLWYISEQGFVNATELERVDVRLRLLDELDETKMVVFAPTPEKTKATITVFTDIDCGYCRKLHQEVPELNELGIAVRYLAYPRAGVGSDSYDKLVSAWCADDPRTALTESKAGQEIENRTCANPVAEHYALGDQFGVTGTPAVVYESGFLQPGYVEATELARRLGVVN